MHFSRRLLLPCPALQPGCLQRPSLHDAHRGRQAVMAVPAPPVTGEAGRRDEASTESGTAG